VCNRLIRKAAADRRGTTAVEFAIIAPALVALLFGAFELGWALHCNESVDYAVNVAARELVATPSLTQSQLQSEVQTQLRTLADPTQVTVTLNEDPASASPRVAHVLASYKHTMNVPMLTGFSYTYNTSSTAVISP
jgi:Flp pilus assembly protein TadG